MKDLNELWVEDESGRPMLEKVLQSGSFRQPHVKAPLARLKKNLAINLGYAVVITIGYLLLCWYFHYWQVQACLALLIAFNCWGMVTSWKMYRKINPDISGHSVLQELKFHHEMFTQWQRQSMRAALFIYPFAAAGGFMLGGTVGSGLPVEAFMSSLSVKIILVVCVAVLVPLSWLLAKWMNKIAFGRYVDELKERIDALEADESSSAPVS